MSDTIANDRKSMVAEQVDPLLDDFEYFRRLEDRAAEGGG